MIWSNFWSVVASLLGALVGIFGVYKTLENDRRGRQQDADRESKIRAEERKQHIKPVIFAQMKESSTDGEESDQINGVYTVFPVLDGNIAPGYRSLRPMFTILIFQIDVQGEFPAKNVKLESFKVSNDDNEVMNFHFDSVSNPLLNSKEKLLRNFQKINDVIRWQKPPLNIFPGDHSEIRVPVTSSINDKNFVLKLATDYLSADEMSLLTNSFIPVTAKFRYEDVDGNVYNDLTAMFLSG